MRRVLKYLALGILCLFAVLLLAVFVLPKTPRGQALVDRIARPIVENVVRTQLGSDIDFDRLQGGLPGEIVIEDVRLTDEGELWASVDRIALDWSPLSLLRRRIVVDSLAIDRPVLYRRPPPAPESEQEDEQPASSEPFSLPELILERLTVRNLRVEEPVFGEAYELSIEASGRTAGQRIGLNASLEETRSRDLAEVELDYDADTLTLDLSVLSAPNGLLAQILDAGDAVVVRLEGAGPLADWEGELDAELGLYGRLAGEIGGNLDDFSAAQAIAAFEPGQKLPEAARQIVGERLFVDLATSREESRIDLAIREATGRFGNLSGNVSIDPSDNLQLAVDLAGDLSEVVLAEFGAAEAAGAVALDGTAAQTEEGWQFGGTLRTELGRLQVENGRSTADTVFAGQVSAELGSFEFGIQQVDRLLAEGAALNAAVEIPAEGPYRASDIDARFGTTEGQRVTLSGDVVFAPEGGALDADIRLQGQRQIMAELIGTETFAGPTTASISAEGTLERLAVDATINYPAGTVGENRFAPGRLVVDADGLPRAPSGTLDLAASDGSYRGRALIATRQEAITIDTLSFNGGNLGIEGSGRIVPSTGAASLDLTARTDGQATLITGQTVAGQVDVKLEAAPDNGPVAASARISNFAFGDIQVESFILAANGPRAEIAFEANATEAVLPSDIYIATLSSTGTLDLAGEATKIALDTLRLALDADTAENRISLRAPTRITLGDEISLAPTRIDWLNDGILTAQGSFGSDRWVAELDGQAVSVPGLTSPLDISLNLDTSAEVPATFSVGGRVERDDVALDLAAEGQWTGQTVDATAQLGDGGNDPLVVARISYPVELTRADGVGIALPDNNIDGVVRVDGDIAPIYAFVPEVPPYLTGQLQGELLIQGTASSPGAEGELRLTDGRFEEDAIGVTFTDLQGTASFSYGATQTRAAIDLTGSGADGRPNAVRLDGRLSLTGEASEVSGSLVLDRAKMVDSPDLAVSASADLDLNGSFDDLLLAGTINLVDVEAGIPSNPSLGGDDGPSYTPIEVVRVDGDLPEEQGEDEEEGENGGFNLRLDLTIESQEPIEIAGRGLESTWITDIRVTGTASNPIIAGVVQIDEGTFEFAGRDFNIEEGRVTFNRTDPSKARLDVRATYETPDDVTAIVSVTGSASDPRIRLSSNPALPQEDVMALILFGKQPTELTAVEQLQVANAARQLIGVGPSFGGGGGGGLQSAFGLDALDFGYDPDTGASVAVGKYLTDDVYVSARQSATGSGTEVTVTYEVNDNVTVESTLKPNGAQNVSANYKKDY
jgi:translocation and assembly module TamB